MEGILGITRNGMKVYDRQNSHFHAEGGLTSDILERAISDVWFKNKADVQRFFVKFDEVIGKTTCVPVTSKDYIVMCKRKGRKGYTPMVKGREGVDARGVVTVLKRKDDEEDGLILLTAYISNEVSPKEPWDSSCTKKERLEAIKYWHSHALLFDESLIDEEGERRIIYE